MLDLSIIVPVYQVELYIRPCFESIFKQGLDECRFEVIIVNDGTKDHSMEMIADIISQHNNITIINQENQGLSVARNNGIDTAKGKYILMPDSDDLLIENSLLPLLEKALETNADLVVANAVEINADDAPPNNLTQRATMGVATKNGKQLFLEDLNPNRCQVWRTLYKRDFLISNNIKFVPGIFYQDVPFTHECYLKAERCLRTTQIMYIYRRLRKGSATATFRKKNAHDFSIAISKTWELTKLNNLPHVIRDKLERDIYSNFTRFVFHTLFSFKHIDRIRAVEFLHSQSPRLIFTFSFRAKVESIFFHWSPRLYIDIRFLILKWHRQLSSLKKLKNT